MPRIKNLSDTYRLLEDRNRYFSLFQNSPYGLIYFDNDTTVIDCNFVFQKIFNLSKDQCIGIKLTEKLKDPQLLNSLKTMFQTGSAQYDNKYISVITGKEIPVKIILINADTFGSQIFNWKKWMILFSG